jgi:2-keto-3-deoxy-L-rhamnonate aldolase RhmA
MRLATESDRNLILMLITNDVGTAGYAAASGVDRIFVDMEVRGKQERQGHLDTHRVAHSPEDVSRIRRELPDLDLLARINPMYERSSEEVDAVIEAGANRLMLPMFHTEAEVADFLQMVDGRAGTTLLLETPQALVRLDRILRYRSRIDEIHVGLNDLHLGMGLTFMFELLSGGIVDFLAEKIKAAGVRFGFGGVARVGEGAVPAELIIGEHVRLGSEMVILSRSFHGRSETLKSLKGTIDLPAEIVKLRQWESHFKGADFAVLEENRRRFNIAAERVVEALQNTKSRVNK